MRTSAVVIGVVSLVGTAALSWLAPPNAAAENPVCLPSGVCAFYSPSRHISCEVDFQRAEITDSAYCQWEDGGTGFSATLSTAGEVTPCLQGSCLGNAGVDTPVLEYGQTAAIGPYVCRSETSGVTCTVTPSGKGFTINQSGITPID